MQNGVPAFSSPKSNGLLEETMIFKSDSFLYLAVLQSEFAPGRWDGEVGWVPKSVLVDVYKDLQKTMYDGKTHFKPFSREVRVMHYGRVVRYGGNGTPLRVTTCTDAESVTLCFECIEELGDFLKVIESCLSWAA